MLTVDDITGLQERIGPGATTGELPQDWDPVLRVEIALLMLLLLLAGHEQKTAALHELQAQLEAATEVRRQGK